MKSILSGSYKDQNIIINGAFDIWQRGTSATHAGGTAFYLADRFASYSLGVNRVVSQVASTVADYPFSYALRYANSVGTTGTRHLIYCSAEGYDTRELYNKRVTASFWIRADKAYTFPFTVYNNTNKFVKNFSVTTGWQRISISLDMTELPASTANGVGYSFAIEAKPASLGTDGIWNTGNIQGVTGTTYAFGATTSDWFETTGWMIHEGVTAAPFRTCGNNFNEELQKCQRYCYKPGFPDTSIVYANLSTGGMTINTTLSICHVQLPVTMRELPILESFTGPIAIQYGGTQIAISALVMNQSSPTIPNLIATAAGGLTSGQSVVLMRNNSGTATLILSAEL